MELKADGLFKNLFKMYYKDDRPEILIEKLDENINKIEQKLIIDATNIAKTSSLLGETFTKCSDRIINKIIEEFPAEEDISLFVLSIILKVLISQGSESLKGFLKMPRDIFKEVTATLYRVPENRVTDRMIKEVKKLSAERDKESYSVIEPVVDNWDEYYYNLCRQVARNSKCLSRRIGSVLVRDKSIISTGYNGPPRGVPRCDFRWDLDSAFKEKYAKAVEGKETKNKCPRYVIGFESGKGLEICPAGHAERNALINAARHGIRTKGTTLYMTCGIPCTPCLVEIINAGVKEIVVSSLGIYDETAEYLLNTSGLKIRLFDFAK